MTELAAGRYIRLCREGRWEWAERVNSTGVVVVVAVTDDDHILLVEQYRPPVQARVVELPAGLAGDLADARDEDFSQAAERELSEETGWVPTRLERLCAGPVSAGMSSEILTWYRATGLRQEGPGGGDAHEDIQVHLIPLDEVDAFLAERAEAGVLTDPKVYAGLYFAHHRGKVS